jgi:hypothetical protein
MTSIRTHYRFSFVLALTCFAYSGTLNMMFAQSSGPNRRQEEIMRPDEKQRAVDLLNALETKDPKPLEAVSASKYIHCFIASSKAVFITGTALIVGGGKMPKKPHE